MPIHAGDRFVGRLQMRRDGSRLLVDGLWWDSDKRIPDMALVLRRYFEASEAHDAWAGLACVRAPSLVLHGTRDPVNVPDNARRLAERLPHAELAWIEGAHHAPFWSHLPDTVQAVSAFLARPPLPR